MVTALRQLDDSKQPVWQLLDDIWLCGDLMMAVLKTLEQETLKLFLGVLNIQATGLMEESGPLGDILVELLFVTIC